MAQIEGSYYVPHGSRWPIVGSIGLFVTLASAANWMNGHSVAEWTFWLGIAIIIFMAFGWFSTVISENQRNLYNDQVDGSFRMGMVWFIFSEVMFFGAFFSALFYARVLSVQWLGGAGSNSMTNDLLWPAYMSVWPTNGPGAIGGAFETIPAWGLRLLNTLLLLSSGVTITFAHHALRSGHRKALLVWLGATILLGATFLYYQAHEYYQFSGLAELAQTR